MQEDALITSQENKTDYSALREAAQRIKQELRQLIVGQEQLVELLLVALLSDGHVLIEGVPGIAKTLTAKLLARTIQADFSRIQFTPDLMPSDVLGTSVFHPGTATFDYKKGPIFANIVLIDEINRAPAKTQSSLFEVMEEQHITHDGQVYPLGAPFIVLATQNPIEQEGTYRLPEAQLDRFMFKVLVDYPSLAEEVSILELQHQGTHLKNNLERVQPVLSAAELLQLRQAVQSVHLDRKLIEYIAQIVGETRVSKSLYLGASPRASIALLNSSKALAALRGRGFVTPEDVQELAPVVLRHRILLTPEREMEGITPDEVIKQIVQKIEVPR
ncbi:AAA family ATPase [Pontibacter akesuensis]|uniref:MoxR-like ATPase n=1 Tax=Pontibacter akesuensis TaxID=388950 RepID=A0A1I7GNW5_9BACT|nr:MoxR family ATPase [Pontibacter akesuensis]GHA55774.1 magnesium chelatase subunit I [Pontibacter akesuensis]SFU50130.1 MoxR-like ATPase [Pontibacter akesuensis]